MKSTVKLTFKRICLLFPIIIVVACSTQEATEEDYLRGADGEAFGPGLLSGDKGSFSVSEAFGNESARKIGGATAYDVDLPAMDQKSFEEYERFKEWRRAQQPDSTEYKEYLEWQEYQRYRRYKQEQSGNAQ